MTFDLRTALAPVIRGDLYYATRPRGARLPVDPNGQQRDMRSDAEAALWAKTRALPVSWLPQSARVLDVGCGPGKLKLARPDLDVYGYEPDDEDWKVAQARGVKDMRTPAWPGASFLPLYCDALFCMDVVEHMTTPERDLKRWLGYVRPGGLVIVECPDFGCPMAQLYGDRFRLLHDPDHVSLFTTESLVRMLRALGVMVEEIAYPYFGGEYDTPENAARQTARTLGEWSPAAPGNLVAVRGRKR